MNFRFKLKRNVYIILTGIVLLAITTQLTNSTNLLKFGGFTLQNHTNWQPTIPGPNPMIADGTTYCVAYDATNEFSNKVSVQAQKVLEYMGKTVAAYNVAEREIPVQACGVFIITTPQLGLIGNMDLVLNEVEKGKYAFVAVTPEANDAFYRVYRKFGLYAIGPPVVSNGIELTENVLIGEKGLVIQDDFLSNTVLNVELNSTCRIYAKTGDKLPLLWDTGYGKGKLMVFNGTMLQEKTSRGMLAGAISLLEPDFMYPIFNAKLFYIDDFPAPFPQGYNQDIFEEYGRSIPRFFRDVWWPDMLQSASRNNVKYTAVIIQTYNDKVNSPFESPVDEDVSGLISYGREVIRSGGELGIHGYNHQSLQTSKQVADEFGYLPWSGVEPMRESVREVVRFFNRGFPGYEPMTYVPPSNVLGPEGREALKQEWPSFTIIASLYGEDADGLSYVQEYGIAQDGLIEMPRVTSGYSESVYSRWSGANAITSLGIFSHFLHPDDLLDADRGNQKDWKELAVEYDQLLTRLQTTYPWLTPRTSYEAAVKLDRTINSGYHIRQEGRTIRGDIISYRGEIDFVLRTDKAIQGTIHCDIQRIDEGVYLVTAKESHFEIKLGG